MHKQIFMDLEKIHVYRYMNWQFERSIMAVNQERSRSRQRMMKAT